MVAFTINILQPDLDDLALRLKQVRWPDPEPPMTSHRVFRSPSLAKSIRTGDITATGAGEGNILISGQVLSPPSTASPFIS